MMCGNARSFGSTRCTRGSVCNGRRAALRSRLTRSEARHARLGRAAASHLFVRHGGVVRWLQPRRQVRCAWNVQRRACVRRLLRPSALSLRHQHKAARAPGRRAVLRSFAFVFARRQLPGHWIGGTVVQGMEPAVRQTQTLVGRIWNGRPLRGRFG